MPYLIRYYPTMIHSNRLSSSSSLYLRREDQFRTSGDGRGGVGTNTTHLSYQKVDFGRDKHDGGFQPYWRHCTAPPMALFLSKYYTVGSSVSYSFGVASGYSKGGVGPRITHLTFRKVDC